MKTQPAILPAILLAAALGGCASPWPTSFQPETVPGWATIEIRDGVGYERAWNTVFEILAREFDFATVLRDEGYIQTDWLHTWSGVYQQDYKVRVTVKFAGDRKSLQVRSEAWVLEDAVWRTGVDSRLTGTLKTDLMGTVGRTTR